MTKKTTLYLPSELLAEAVKLSGAPSKTNAVVLGLEELIRKKRREALLSLKGSGVLRLTQKDVRRMRAR